MSENPMMKSNQLNTAAAGLLSVEKIPGPFTQGTQFKNVFRVEEVALHGHRNIKPGESGLQQSNSQVHISHLEVVLFKTPQTPLFANAGAQGQDLGAVTVTLLTNISTTNDVVATITLTNPRVATTVLDFHYNPDVGILDAVHQKGISLLKNHLSLAHHYYNVEVHEISHMPICTYVSFAYDAIKITYESYEDTGIKAGTNASSYNLTNNTGTTA